MLCFKNTQFPLDHAQPSHWFPPFRFDHQFKLITLIPHSISSSNFQYNIVQETDMFYSAKKSC